MLEHLANHEGSATLNTVCNYQAGSYKPELNLSSSCLAQAQGTGSDHTRGNQQLDSEPEELP